MVATDGDGVGRRVGRTVRGGDGRTVGGGDGRMVGRGEGGKVIVPMDDCRHGENLR